MPDVTIALPRWETTSTVEIEVSVQGRNTRETYRVITVPCSNEAASDRAGQLRRAVLTVEPGWQLVSIGTPSDTGIPLLFRCRETVTN